MFLASGESERQRGWAPLAAAGLLLLGLCTLRFLFDADETRSFFLGRAFGSACWFRSHFGIPCPNCGMTRSLILAAHGEFTRSLKLAAGGAAMVLATALTSLMLGLLGIAMLVGNRVTTARMKTNLRVTVLASAGVVATVWIGGWVYEIARSVAHR